MLQVLQTAAFESAQIAGTQYPIYVAVRDILRSPSSALTGLAAPEGLNREPTRTHANGPLILRLTRASSLLRPFARVRGK